MNYKIIAKDTNFKLKENFLSNIEGRDNVHYAASEFGIDSDKFVTQEEAAEAVSKEILLHPKHFLQRLLAFEMEIVKAIVKAGSGKAVQFRLSDTIIPMCLLNLANIYTDVQNEKTRVWMADDLRESIAPYIDEVAESEEYVTAKEFEQYVIGCLNLYGAMIEDELLELVADFYEDDEIEQGMKRFHEGFASVLCSIDMEHDGQRTKLYFPPFTNPTEDLLHYYHSRLERAATNDFKPYDFEQILAAGDVTNIRIPNAHHERLVKCLMKTCSMSRSKATDTIFMMWRESQDEMDPRDIVAYVMKFCEYIEVRKVLLKNLVKYLNYMPMWVLKGYTSMDILAINPTKVGVTSDFGDHETEDDGLPELFGDVEITRLGDVDDMENYPFGFGPMGEA